MNIIETAILIVKDGSFNPYFYSILSMRNLHVNVEYTVFIKELQYPIVFIRVCLMEDAKKIIDIYP